MGAHGVAAGSIERLERLLRSPLVRLLAIGGLALLLQLDDHALLAGAGALFLILAAIMYATRAVDWHAAGSKPERAGGGT